MTDSRVRELERRWLATATVEDHAAWLRERVRVGLLPRVELEVAAFRGDRAAALAARELPAALLVVHFWAPWNNHDVHMRRALARLQLPEVEWLLHRQDIDEDEEFAFACGVKMCPILVACRAGVELGRLVGPREDDALATWLRGMSVAASAG